MKKIGTILLIFGVLAIIGGIGAGIRGGDPTGAGGGLILAILGWYMRNRQVKEQQINNERLLRI